MKKEYLECGKVTSQHGVRGAVKAESWCDSPSVLASIPALWTRGRDGSYSPLTPVTAAPYKGQVLFTFREVNTVEGAIALRGQVLLVRREDFPLKDGQVLWQDLIGLPVVDANTNERYGVLREINETPSSDLYVIDTPHGEVLLPAVPAYIRKLDPDSGIFVTPIPGFFTAAEEVGERSAGQNEV